MAEQFSLGVRTSIYNNELRKRRLAKGITQAQLGALVGLGKSTLSHIETFRKYPTREQAIKIAKVLGCPVFKIFPAWLQEYKIERSSVDRELMVDSLSLHSPEVLALEASDDYLAETADNELMADNINEALKVLTPREQKVVIMRFGINGYAAHSLDDVAKEFSVSRERIRQIEAKALAKLRQKAKVLFPWGQEIKGVNNKVRKFKRYAQTR